MRVYIHLHIELKVFGKWEHYANLLIKQDTRFFKELKKRSIKNKKLKTGERLEDFNIITKLDYDYRVTCLKNVDCYYCINLQGIKLLGKWAENNYYESYALEHNELKIWLLGTSFTNFELGEYPEWVEDIRFIWFDD